MSAGGKGTSGKQITAEPDPAVSAFANEVRTQSKGTREEVFRQVEEALRTGGIEARLPIAQKSVEASKSATSQALRTTDESLGRAGLAGTPFGTRIRGEIAQQGAQATESIYPSIAKQFIDIAPNLALGSGNTVISGLSNASSIGMQGAIAGKQLDAQRDIAQLQFYGQIIGALLGAGGSAAGGALAT